MLRYTLRRLSFLPIILIAVSIFVFVLLRVLAHKRHRRRHRRQQRDGGAEESDPRAVPPQRSDLSDHLRHAARLSSECSATASTRAGWWTRCAATSARRISARRACGRSSFRRFPASFEIVALSLFFSVVVRHLVRDPFGHVPEQSRSTTSSASSPCSARPIPEFFLLSLLIIIPSYLWNYSPPVGGYVPIYRRSVDEPPAVPARRAGHRHRRIGRLDAARAHDDAGGAAQRLRAHRESQGAAAAHGDPDARVAERQHADPHGRWHGVHRRVRRFRHR